MHDDGNIPSKEVNGPERPRGIDNLEDSHKNKLKLVPWYFVLRYLFIELHLYFCGQASHSLTLSVVLFSL